MNPKFEIECLAEDSPVRGSFASGDADQDRETEDKILADLNRGNEWAWCCVKVTASITANGQVFAGDAYLGACSYDSEADFRADGYFDDLCAEALASLRGALADAVIRGSVASSALATL